MSPLTNPTQRTACRQVVDSEAKIVVVIATKDRPELLLARSIGSVEQQSRTPDLVILVDDSSTSPRLQNQIALQTISSRGIPAVYLANSRTPGPSGSWNTALDFLTEEGFPGSTFVAILDDDDSWHPDYLKKCESTAVGAELDMIAADFYRVESTSECREIVSAPDVLVADDFLTGNPGIQGSNLFLRLSTFLMAGGFDETLRSCTDRDVCIRIADLGTTSYTRLPEPLVYHFAEAERARISTRGSKAKLEGLDAFWLKHAGRMRAEQRESLITRAQRLFDWSPKTTHFLRDRLNQSYAPQPKPSDENRLERARTQVVSSFAAGPLRLLGVGKEAVVFTDEERVFKCIASPIASKLSFLRTQIGCWAGLPGLYSIVDIVESGPFQIIVYDFEPSTSYGGRREDEIISLLNSCTEAGIVCNNIHPKNLVITRDEVKLIDYGADIRPWTALGFEHMARRAFLTCHHAHHPSLEQLLKAALHTDRLAELDGYQEFRQRLRPAQTVQTIIPSSEPLERITVYVGVITSEPRMLVPLLQGLRELSKAPVIKRLAVSVLDNASPKHELDALKVWACDSGLEMAVVSSDQQAKDAACGAFGGLPEAGGSGKKKIATARTILQRYLGALLEEEPDSFGWLLDDDMRIDENSAIYLAQLPEFRRAQVDAIFGAYQGSSPNPPLNGLRGQLVDLYHNIVWMRELPEHELLPDRSAENQQKRAQFCEYYYDLSRKHTGHLETPFWIEPLHQFETVEEAYQRLISQAHHILNGAPLARGVVVSQTQSLLSTSRESVNRGGCTFVLNHLALTQTPNPASRINGREARRSDMFWAIVNRNYRKMVLKAVEFPIQHLGRVNANHSIDIEKVQEELVGSAIYAGLVEFLKDHPHHSLDFSMADATDIQRITAVYLKRRLLSLEQSFFRIEGLREALRRLARPNELELLIEGLDTITSETFHTIRRGVETVTAEDLNLFLNSMRSVADEYAMATVSTDFIHAQFRSKP